MFYDKFVFLCNRKSVSPSRAAMDAGISKSLVTKWKNNNAVAPSTEVLKKLSDYFDVPVDYLLGRYNDLTTNIGGVHVITWAHGSAEERLEAFVEGTYRIVKQEPGFLVIVDNDANATDEEIAGIIALHNSSMPKTEKAPAVSGERSVSDDDIKFALFGGDGEITDAMYDEVRRFAAFIKQREADKNKE